MRVLLKHGLIPDSLSVSTRYGEHANVRFYKLTDRGLRIASQLYLNYLEDVRERLEAVLKGYPKTLLRVVALSASSQPGMFDWIEVVVDACDVEKALGHALHNAEIMVVDWGELRESVEQSKRVYGDLRLVHGVIDEARPRMYNASVYEIFVSKLVVWHKGLVHSKALELMAKLEKLGLVARVPFYDSKGRYVTDAYRAPPELAAYILGIAADPLPREAILSVFAAHMLYQAMRRELRKRELLAAIDKLGLSEKMVKMLVEMLHARGVTTRYNDAGGPDSPHFIVLDEEKARNEIERAVMRAEEVIVSPEA